LRIVSDFFWQELQSHKSPEASVLGFVHHTHPPAAQLLHDPVMQDGLADHESSSNLA
jgi:hypothetical protein